LFEENDIDESLGVLVINIRLPFDVACMARSLSRADVVAEVENTRARARLPL
jgi:hypothetical protein